MIGKTIKVQVCKYVFSCWLVLALVILICLVSHLLLFGGMIKLIKLKRMCFKIKTSVLFLIRAGIHGRKGARQMDGIKAQHDVND